MKHLNSRSHYIYHTFSGVANSILRMTSFIFSEIYLTLIGKDKAIKEGFKSRSLSIRMGASGKYVDQLNSEEIGEIIEQRWFHENGLAWGRQQFQFFKEHCKMEIDNYPSTKSFSSVFYKIKDILNQTKADRSVNIFEIGCLQGRMLLPFANKENFQCIGVDLNQEAIKEGMDLCREYKNIELHYLDANQYLEKHETVFDHTFISTVLAYMSFDFALKLLIELRQSKKITNLYIYDQQFVFSKDVEKSQYAGYYNYSYHHNYLELLKEAGYEILNHRFEPAFSSSNIRDDRYFIFVEAKAK